MARFKRAKVLVDLKKIPEAIVDLEALKDMAPDEALVHYQLARCYKMRRDKAGAIKHFTMAGNLDPKVCFSVELTLAFVQFSMFLLIQDVFLTDVETVYRVCSTSKATSRPSTMTITMMTMSSEALMLMLPDAPSCGC